MESCELDVHGASSNPFDPTEIYILSIRKKKEKKESWSTSFLLAVVASYCLDNVSYRYRQFLTVKSCFHSDLQIVEQTYCMLQSPIMKCEKGYIFVCI